MDPVASISMVKLRGGQSRRLLFLAAQNGTCFMSPPGNYNPGVASAFLQNLCTDTRAYLYLFCIVLIIRGTSQGVGNACLSRSFVTTGHLEDF